MTETRISEVKRWTFDIFKGSFELNERDWVDIIDPMGGRATMHRDQIMAMAKRLEHEDSWRDRRQEGEALPRGPKHILKD
jgi:hypothetical protein